MPPQSLSPLRPLERHDPLRYRPCLCYFTFDVPIGTELIDWSTTGLHTAKKCQLLCLGLNYINAYYTLVIGGTLVNNVKFTGNILISTFSDQVN